MSTLGERLKILRQGKEMTQEDLAAQLRVNRATLANWEINRTQPDYDSLRRIASYFDVSIDYLLDNIELRPIPPAPWMDKLKPETRARLDAVGGLRGFHTRFLGGKGLNNLASETLEIIMESYFEHLEREAEAAKKAKEGRLDGDN